MGHDARPAHGGCPGAVRLARKPLAMKISERRHVADRGRVRARLDAACPLRMGGTASVGGRGLSRGGGRGLTMHPGDSHRFITADGCFCLRAAGRGCQAPAASTGVRAALVAFVGGPAWTASVQSAEPLLAGFRSVPEAFVPAYRVTSSYVQRMNAAHAVNVNATAVYVNRDAPGALTAVPRKTFVGAKPVAAAAIAVPRQQAQAAQIVGSAAPVAPERASIAGPATTRAAAPPPTAATRQVVVRRTPPPTPLPFTAKRAELERRPATLLIEQPRCSSANSHRACRQAEPSCGLSCRRHRRLLAVRRNLYQQPTPPAAAPPAAKPAPAPAAAPSAPASQPAPQPPPSRAPAHEFTDGESQSATGRTSAVTSAGANTETAGSPARAFPESTCCGTPGA